MTGEVRDGVHVIELALGDRVSRLYLFVGQRSAVLFDTGCAGDIERHVLPYLASVGLASEQVGHVVVSHCDVDHFGGLGDVERFFPRARRLAHALDAPVMEVEAYLTRRAREFSTDHGLDEPQSVVDWTRGAASGGGVTGHVDEGDVLDLGGRTVRVLHVPGHSRGHLAIWDEGTGVLAVGDAVLGEYVPLADGSPSFPPTYRHAVDYRRTIERIEGIDFEVLGTAHYPETGPDSGRSLLTRSRAFADELEERLLVALDPPAPARTLRDLVSELGPQIGTWPAEGRGPALAQPVMGHLEDLVARGRAELHPGRPPRWTGLGRR